MQAATATTTIQRPAPAIIEWMKKLADKYGVNLDELSREVCGKPYGEVTKQEHLDVLGTLYRRTSNIKGHDGGCFSCGRFMTCFCDEPNGSHLMECAGCSEGIDNPRRGALYLD